MLAKSPGGGPPAFAHEDVDRRRARRSRRRTNPAAPSAVPTSATSGTQLVADPAGRVLDRAPGRGRRSRRCTPSAASAAAVREARAPATPPRPRPAVRRSRDPSRASSRVRLRWIGPAPSRSDAAPVRPVRDRDDLGADRDRGLLRGAGADVEPDRRHAPGPGRRRRPRPRAAARPAPRACAASPSRRGSRRRSASAATIAGTSNLRVVGEHAHRVARPELVADLGEVAVGPVVDDLVGHREPLRRSRTPRARRTP